MRGFRATLGHTQHGWDTAAEILRMPGLSATPIVFLSSGDPSDKPPHADLETCSRIVKPVTPDNILASMNKRGISPPA